MRIKRLAGMNRKGEDVKIQILGTGCPKCKALASNAESAVTELGLNAEIEKVTGIQDILKFQILMMPGLVIDGQVKTAGRVPSTDEIKQLLTAAEENQ
jgi:small redox-active disulfide protein 2